MSAILIIMAGVAGSLLDPFLWLGCILAARFSDKFFLVLAASVTWSILLALLILKLSQIPPQFPLEILILKGVAGIFAATISVLAFKLIRRNRIKDK